MQSSLPSLERADGLAGPKASLGLGHSSLGVQTKTVLTPCASSSVTCTESKLLTGAPWSGHPRRGSLGNLHREVGSLGVSLPRTLSHLGTRT